MRANSYRVHPERFERFCERHALDRKAWLVIWLFIRPEQSVWRAALDLAHGIGPAAVALGRCKER
jgi:hypothetical protein